MTKKIILASGSKTRRILMDSLGIVYETLPANIDEKSIRDDDLIVRAKKIAQAKGEAVIQKEPAVIIAADTFSVFENLVLEKPIDLNQAVEMLKMISGKTIMSLTGFYYIDKYSEQVLSTVAQTDLKIRNLSEEEIKIYVESSPVLTWAASYNIAYPYGASLVEEIKGSLSGCLYGLPTEFLIPQLELSGIKISPK